MPEGFGHFVASAAFNTLPQEDPGAPEGVFRYYKEIDPETAPAYGSFVDPEGDDYQVALDGGASAVGGASRWVELQCDDAVEEGDWDPPGQVTEVTSEIDWVRFYWGFLTADLAPIARPEFWDVVHLVAYTQVNEPWVDTPPYGPLWQNMLDAVGDAGSGLTAYQGRMAPLDLANGVYNDAN